MTASSKRIRSVLIFAFALVVALTAGFESLKIAANKNFWYDEIFDLETTLASPAAEMLGGNVKGQVSGSPLYYVAQKSTVKHLLGSEDRSGRGWDWRVSIRVVSILSVMLGIFAAVLLLFGVHPFLGALVPIFLVNDSMVNWYGAEARPYAMWLATSLVFYCVSLRQLMKDRMTVLDCALWTFSGVACIGVAISSIKITMSVMIAMAVARLLSGRANRLFWLQAGLASAIFLGCYQTWQVWHSPLLLANATETTGYYFRHFQRQALAPLGGSREAIMLLLGASGLVLAGLIWKRARYARVYLAVGAITLSQLLLLPVSYSMQILKGYFYSSRHAIFECSIRYLIVSACVLLAVEGIEWIAERLKSSGPVWPPKKLRPVLIALAMIVFGFDWVHWSLVKIGSEVSLFGTLETPYCGRLTVPAVVGSAIDPDERRTREFNQLNARRHRGDCSSSQADTESAAADFHPSWIYGQNG